MNADEVGRRRVRVDTVVPAREHFGIELHTGEVLRIIDVEGKQVADLVCFNVSRPEERLSTNNSIAGAGRWLLTTGDVLYSDEGNAMLRIGEDSVGIHKASAGCCSAANNMIRYGKPGARNCLDNLVAASAPLALTPKDIPGAFCTFMNVVQHPDGTQEVLEPTSVAGDYVELRAEMDLFVAISNCPQEFNPCNGFRPTDIRVLVL